MQANVLLEAFGKALEHHVHVDAVRVGPRVLEAFLEPLPERILDLMEANKLFHLDHLRLVARCAAVQPLYDCTVETKLSNVRK